MKAVLILIVVWAPMVFGQTADTVWTRTYGGYYYDMIRASCPTEDGGALVCGYTSSIGGANNDVWVLRLGSSGDTLWTRTYGGPWSDECYAVAATQDGNFALAGTTDPYSAGQDMWLLKINAAGDTLWTRVYGGPSGDLCYALAATSDGGFILGGTTYSTSGSWDMYAVRVDAYGTQLWARAYSRNSYDICEALVQEGDGGFLLTGVTHSYDGSNENYWVVKINANGDSLWSRSYGGTGNEHCRSIAPTIDGGYVLAGNTQSFAVSQNDFWLLKINSFGDSLWSRSYGGYGDEYATSLVSLGTGGYVIAGTTTSYGLGYYDMWIVATDNTGDSLWNYACGGYSEDQCWSLSRLAGGDYILGGYTSSFGAGYNDGYVARVRPPSLLALTVPDGGEQWTILNENIIRWIGINFNGSIRIEVNRGYPNGAWEVLADSTENDGEFAWFVTDPLSNACRVRISAVEDTLVDVSDGNFSIVSSSGYLALVRPGAPNAPVLNWSGGTVECPGAAGETLRLKNFGSEAVVVFQPLEPASAEFARATTCGSFFALAPGQMSACSLALTFDPGNDGLYRDTLRIQTDAVNGVGGFVRIPLAGTQISTPATPVVVIAASGEDAVLNWQPVTQSVGGCPVDVTRYLVFYSSADDGTYEYHGWTAGTTYTHAGAITYASGMFYRVEAIAGNVRVDGLVRGMTREEVHAALRR